jgi:hypothetical protein
MNHRPNHRSFGGLPLLIGFLCLPIGLMATPASAVAQQAADEAATAAPSLQRQVAELREEVRELRVQVAELTLRLREVGGLASGAPESAGEVFASPDASADAAQPWAFVDSVQTLQSEPGEADAQRVTQLRNEISQLDATIASVGERLATAGTQHGATATAEQSVAERELRARQEAQQRQREQRAVRTVLARYRQQRDRRVAELNELEGDSGLRQVIHGHRDDRLITLESTGDLFGDQTPPTDWRVVMWEGRLVTADDEHEHWRVETVRGLDAPPGDR